MKNKNNKREKKIIKREGRRILFVVDDRRAGGVSALLENLFDTIKFNQTDNVDLLILNDDGNMFQNLNNNITVFYGTKYFDFINLSVSELIKTKQYLKALKKIYISTLMKTGLVKGYIKKKREDLGIVDYDIEIAFKAGFCTLFTAFSTSKKKINWIHEDYKLNDNTKKYRKLFNKCLNLFDKNILVSDGALESFKEIYPHIINLQVIENYINIEKIINLSNQPSIEAEKIQLSKDKINIVSVGRLCKEKGYDRIINACIKLKKEGVLNENMQLDIIAIGGNNIYGNVLEETLKKSNLTEVKIYFAEGNSNYYPVIKKYDACLMASRSESFGIARVEALVLHVPVITTDVAASKKLLKSNLYGFIVENSETGIYEALKRVMQNKSILVKLKENTKEFNYEENNNEIFNKINKLLEV